MNERQKVIDDLLVEFQELVGWTDWQGHTEVAMNQQAAALVNFVADRLDPQRKAIHEGVHHPNNFDWHESASQDGTHLNVCGEIGVDSASVTVTIGDISPDFRMSIYTPEGDGSYQVLAGRVRGIGRCLVVAFDLPQSDFPSWASPKGERDE